MQPVKQLVDEARAFVEVFDDTRPMKDGPLSDLSFAVKDNIATAGSICGNGNPRWRDQQKVENRSASVVQSLLGAGANLIGRTHMDELAYSLTGTNVHYGTPCNPASPSRVPGGSSSGSAAAVAQGEVDFALGTDTGGSIRLPASACGLFGIRPTHGAVSLDGVVPLAPSYDTVGWFSRDAAVLGKVARVFFAAEALKLECLWQPDEIWTSFRHLLPSLNDTLDRLTGQFVNKVTDPLPIVASEVRAKAFSVCQGREIWETLGSWVSRNEGAFATDVAARLAAAARLTDAEVDEASAVRTEIRSTMHSALVGRVLVLPTLHAVAPLLTSSAEELFAFRQEAIGLLSIAGHAGLPQISIPVKHEGSPIGLSIIGPPGSDLALVEIVERMTNVAENQ